MPKKKKKLSLGERQGRRLKGSQRKKGPKPIPPFEETGGVPDYEREAGEGGDKDVGTYKHKKKKKKKSNGGRSTDTNVPILGPPNIPGQRSGSPDTPITQKKKKKKRSGSGTPAPTQQRSPAPTQRKKKKRMRARAGAARRRGY